MSIKLSQALLVSVSRVKSMFLTYHLNPDRKGINTQEQLGLSS